MRISEAQDAYHVALAAEDCIDPAREKAWNSSSYQDQTTFAAFGGASASTTTENLLLGDSGDKNLALLSFPDDARHRSDSSPRDRIRWAAKVTVRKKSTAQKSRRMHALAGLADSA